jgi:molecular chaperone DnaJ
MASKLDYYRILEVERSANEEELKDAYLKLARKYHPDFNPGDEKTAEAKFKEVTEAYEVLRDPEKRSRYDRYGHAGLDGAGMGGFGGQTIDPFELFARMMGLGGLGDFGEAFGGRRGGRDRVVEVELDLLEAATGLTRPIEVDRAERCGECGGNGMKRGTRPTTCPRCRGRGVFIQQAGFIQMQTTCRACGGRGQIISEPCEQCEGHGLVRVRRKLDVQIPAGVDTGIRIRLAGEGDAGEAGAPRGDLFLQVKVRKHHLFHREGTHLLCEVPISFSQAALGGEIEVPTLQGKETLSLPRGTQHGDNFRLRGKGMPDLRGRGAKGDIVVHVMIETPKKLTKRQEELLRELADIEQKHVTPQRKSFLDQLKGWFVGDGGEATEMK